MSKYQVTVYTTNQCPSCQTLKKWLVDKQVDFEVANIETDSEKQQQLIEKTGSFLVPVTVIIKPDGQEEIIYGTQYAQLKKALNLN